MMITLIRCSPSLGVQLVLRTLFLCLGIWLSEATFAAVPETLKTVVVRPAVKSEVAQTLTYPAAVQARVHATVLAEADGVVRKIHVPLGGAAKRGQKLLTIQQTDPIFQYAPVATHAPVAGQVSELFVTEGALVTKGQKLAAVTNPKDLKVLVEVPARDMMLLQSGLLGRFEGPGLASDALELRLSGLSPNVDPATGTATAELIPSAKDSVQLRPGMVGKITFKGGSHQGFLVPEDIVSHRQDKTYLRIVQDGKAQRVPVKLGMRLRGQVEIVEGLSEGQFVVERMSGFIADGDKVTVENAEAKP